jgi:hypothetical protein
MRKRVKPDPYGTEEEFRAYIKSSRRKAVLYIVLMLLLMAAMYFIPPAQ